MADATRRLFLIAAGGLAAAAAPALAAQAALPAFTLTDREQAFLARFRRLSDRDKGTVERLAFFLDDAGLDEGRV